MLEEQFANYARHLASALLTRFLRYAVVTPANDNWVWL